MKAKHRHELQTNELAEWLEGSIERVTPYARTITAVVVAAAILLGAYWYVSSSERRARLAAADRLVAALQTGQPPQELQATIVEYGGSQPALIAQLLLAEQMLSRGTSQLYVDRPAARDNIMKAIDVFRASVEPTREPMLRAWASFGLGRSYESLGNLDAAREEYKNVLKEYSEGALADDVRRRLENLERPSTKAFYDWFAAQDPRPAPTGSLPGTPGLKPAFDLQGSGEEVKFPSSLDPTVPGPQRPAPETSEPSKAPAAPTSDVTPGETFQEK